jgi:predicted enzyme related to lactoylglutathione lyase
MATTGNAVAQFQIVSQKPEQSAAFYSKLFNWKVSADNAMGYRTLDPQAKTGIPGGIWPCPPEGKPMVQLFVEVPDVSAHVAKAKSLGANVVIPPSKLPDGDEMAVILDPDGLPLGLMTARRGGK